MFASTLIFEEFVDYYNHKVGTTEGITDILKQVNYEHHVDESRHVSFGREMVPRLYRLALERSADPEATRADGPHGDQHVPLFHQPDVQPGRV